LQEHWEYWVEKGELAALHHYQATPADPLNVLHTPVEEEPNYQHHSHAVSHAYHCHPHVGIQAAYPGELAGDAD